MIAYVEDMNTGTCPNEWFIDSPTSIYYSYLDDEVAQIIDDAVDEIALIKLQNSIKATETIVKLMKNYKSKIYVSYKANTCVILRCMNSFSGRITRKLKKRMGKI